eukprot:TRINITY_DN8153_c1_g2_i1.p1 TRINITY_DN8153_c1_g2~~TRINITY_DN8153_c1_g2_i1.p1  ORF type:complete len:179 (+),score=24.54 TRINITY_DN8153_c1_g2_i1:70-606(+)
MASRPPVQMPELLFELPTGIIEADPSSSSSAPLEVSSTSTGQLVFHGLAQDLSNARPGTAFNALARSYLSTRRPTGTDLNGIAPPPARQGLESVDGFVSERQRRRESRILFAASQVASSEFADQEDPLEPADPSGSQSQSLASTEANRMQHQQQAEAPSGSIEAGAEVSARTGSLVSL